MNILVVDDDALIGTVLMRMLERDGYRVELAGGGAEGIACFGAAADAGNPFDLVFTDLSMPQVDGYQVAAAVKQRQPSVRVVLLSGWATGSPSSTPDSRVDRILSKPARLRDLREVVAGLTPVPENENEPQDFAALRREFLARSLREIPGLEAALERLRDRAGRQPEEFGALVHRLGGSAAVFGVTGMAEQVGRVRELLAVLPENASPASWEALQAQVQGLESLLRTAAREQGTKGPT